MVLTVEKLLKPTVSVLVSNSKPILFHLDKIEQYQHITFIRILSIHVHIFAWKLMMIVKNTFWQNKSQYLKQSINVSSIG